MLWTIAILGTGVPGMLLSARHWWGWAISFANEVLWFFDGIHTHNGTLTMMAVVWGLGLLRNVAVTKCGSLRGAVSEARRAVSNRVRVQPDAASASAD